MWVKMVEALVLLAPGFEEIETVAVIDVLRRSGIGVTVAGLLPDLVEGAHGIKVAPDKAIEAVQTLPSPVESEVGNSDEAESVLLPPELVGEVLERIVDAVEMGDVSQVKSIAEKVMSEFPVTSTISYKFIQLAENFDLDGILNLVQELKD